MTHKQKQAVALYYDGESAPRLSAKGNADIAEKILAIAAEHNIPIREEPELVTVLSMLQLGEEIPKDLYVAIAEIIAFAYMIKVKKPSMLNR